MSKKTASDKKIAKGKANALGGKKPKKDRVFAKKAAALGNNLKRFWKEPPKGRFLNLQEILRFGISSLGVSFIANLVSMYVTVSQIPLLYNLGSSGTLHATIMYLVASLLALIIAPFYGRMIQRTKTKFGRYKPYILFLAPVVAILGAAAVWSPQNLNETQRIIYVYMLCTPTLLMWNLWYNTFNLFPGVITPNQQERADIWSPIGLVIGFAPTIMNALKGVFVKWGGNGDVGAARIYGVFCAVVGIALTIALIGVKERVFVTQEEEKKEKVSTFEGLKMIIKNKPLMVFTLALCLGCLKNTIDLSWEVIARVKYATDMASAAAIFGGLSLVVGFAATPNMILLPWLTRKFNNRTILIFWQACNLSANLVCALIGLQHFPQGSWSPYVITIIRFVSMFNCLGSLQPLILSEIGDLQQAKSGYRLEGFIQTFAYQIPLVVSQAAALIPAAIQSKMGFNPYNYQVTDTVTTASPELIKIAENYGNVALWLSTVSSALMLICFLFYNYNKKKHAEVVAQLKATSVNSEEIANEQGSLNMLENVVGGVKEEKVDVSDGNADTVTASEETTTDEVPQEQNEISSEQEDDSSKSDFD